MSHVRYAYYPGCSSDNLTAAYDRSFRAVAQHLGMEVETISDWNCCGATEYPAVSRMASYAAAARNLALVDSGCREIIAACSACYLNLLRTDKIMGEDEGINQRVNVALGAGGLAFAPGRLRIRHILEALLADVGLEHIQASVTRPLAGVRIAPYYGCLLVRPLRHFDQPEYPTGMDRLLTALGAEVTGFTLRSYCCGGHLPQIKTDTGLEIIYRILRNVQNDGAHLIAVACPVCQLNLDLYQRDVNRRFGTRFEFPVLFFTQLMSLAFGLDPAATGIDEARLAGAENVKEPTGRRESSTGRKKDRKSVV